ncbi:MAG: glutamate racemase [Acidobacteria bacterium]|nr:MAG: glutamate racemase [Acidobacteriota bacterium]
MASADGVDPRPIGVFDSGVGGLTVAAALMRRLPHESILYLGDTARLPYGTKSPQTVRRYTEKNVSFLLQRGVKAVVVACNTASALALDDFPAPVPLWGVIEPGVDAAIARTRGRVGVIGTESTIRSGAYPRALCRRRPELEVRSQACGLLVPLIEEGWHDDPVTAEVAGRYLAPLHDAGVDTLVLGCTHYPLIKPLLQRLAGDGVALVDSAEVMAETVARAVADGRIRPAPDARPQHHLCVTDAGPHFQRIAGAFLHHPASLELVEV